MRLLLTAAGITNASIGEDRMSTPCYAIDDAPRSRCGAEIVTEGHWRCFPAEG